MLSLTTWLVVVYVLCISIMCKYKFIISLYRDIILYIERVSLDYYVS